MRGPILTPLIAWVFHEIASPRLRSRCVQTREAIVNFRTALDVRTALEELERRVVSCRRCPRLVEWRERVAAEKRAAFAD